MLNSYPSIFNLGHRAIANLLSSPVVVEEKIDGSQFSFSKGTDGVLRCRSKGAEINMLAPEGMFSKAVATVQELEPLLRPGITYRGEYLQKPKHNALAYDRVPVKHIILFDVMDVGPETYFDRTVKEILAGELGLELVPQFFVGTIDNIEQFRTFLDRESVLGGQKIEGVVIKPVQPIFGSDKKPLLGKFVSEAFREIHMKTWNQESKPQSHNDILQILKAKYGTTARWQKAVIHLAERGALQDSPVDIGLLMKEVPEDVLKECYGEIMEDLFRWAWPQLRRMLGSGLPEWYKEELLKKQFAAEPQAVS